MVVLATYGTYWWGAQGLVAAGQGAWFDFPEGRRARGEWASVY